MPLKPEVNKLIEEAGRMAAEDGYILLGIFVNHNLGEMGVFSSQEWNTGTTLGFIQNASGLMLDKAREGELREVPSQIGLVH